MSDQAGAIWTDAWLAEKIRHPIEVLGDFAILAWKVIQRLFHRHFPVNECLVQFHVTVIRSIPIAAIAALFTGLVLALQTVDVLARFGAKAYTGNMVGLSIVLEMGPVLTALMVGGRVGAGISAEIGSMMVSEQVDAIRVMGACPIQKLVLPRVLSMTVGLPMLTVLADILGILGGLVIAMGAGISQHYYMTTVFNAVDPADFISGLMKTVVFGYLVAMIACFNALRTYGGTVGVGRATTQTVVVASISVLVSDFFLTKILLAVL